MPNDRREAPFQITSKQARLLCLLGLDGYPLGLDGYPHRGFPQVCFEESDSWDLLELQEKGIISIDEGETDDFGPYVELTRNGAAFCRSFVLTAFRRHWNEQKVRYPVIEPEVEADTENGQNHEVESDTSPEAEVISLERVEVQLGFGTPLHPIRQGSANIPKFLPVILGMKTHDNSQIIFEGRFFDVLRSFEYEEMSSSQNENQSVEPVPRPTSAEIEPPNVMEGTEPAAALTGFVDRSPALTDCETMVVRALRSIGQPRLATVRDIVEELSRDADDAFGENERTLVPYSERSVRNALISLIDRDLVERPRGGRNGARLTEAGVDAAQNL